MKKVEVIYALENEQKSFYVMYEDSITAEQAIINSKILNIYNISNNIDDLKFGIYGKEITKDYILNENDRLEIYRDLIIDPKDARMIRAENKRKKEGLKKFGA